MNSIYSQLLHLAMPQVIVVATALLVMAIDLLFHHGHGMHLRGFSELGAYSFWQVGHA